MISSVLRRKRAVTMVMVVDRSVDQHTFLDRTKIRLSVRGDFFGAKKLEAHRGEFSLVQNLE